MANYRLPEMSLKQVAFQPSEFTPQVFTPQASNPEILSRSIDKLEARINTANERQATLDTTMADLQLKLHNDKETQQWFDDYKKNINQQIQEQVDSGNYANAIRVATSLAAKVKQDPAIQGRMRAESNYQQELKVQQSRRDKNEISQTTYEWWLKNNPYKYEDNYDNEGNVIGGTEYTPEFRPVNDINWASQAQIAFKLITPYKNSKQSSTNEQVSDDTDGTGATTVRGSGSSKQVERVTKQDILDNIESLLSATPDGYRQAEQAYEVAKYDYQKLVDQYNELFAKDPKSDKLNDLAQKIEERGKLMTKNGSPIDYKEYYARNVINNHYSDKLAYENYATSSSSNTVDNTKTTTKQPTVKTRSSLFPFAGAKYDPSTRTWVGPMVEQASDTERGTQSVSEAASGIDDLLGGQ